MTFLARILTWLRSLLGRRRLERQMDVEFQFHVQTAAEELMARGVAREEAYREASQAFGSLAAAKDDCRASLGVRLMDELRVDLRDSLRSLRLNPGFTAAAVLTLALGIGPNSAIVAVVDAVVFRPLPYQDPSRLVSMWTPSLPNQPTNLTVSGDTLGGHGDRLTISPANLVDYRRDNPAFTELAGFTFTGANLTDDGSPERLYGEKVTPNFFRVLGVAAASGRTFADGEDRPGTDRVVILTTEIWTRRFGQDPAIVGRPIQLDQSTYHVIGILPAGFKSPFQLIEPETISYYVPAAYSAAQLADRTTMELNVIGRLKPGVSIETAGTVMDAISTQLEQRFPETNRNIHVSLTPLRDDIASGSRTSMLALAGAVGAILLIACINLANLLVARAVGRQQEISVRFSLGATRGRLIRSLLVHQAVVAVLGCAVGLLAGSWTTHLLVGAAPVAIPRLGTAAVDLRVALITTGVSVTFAMLFGLLPALQASRARPAEALRAGGRGVAGGAVARWRAALMVAELSLSMTLLIGAALLLKSFLAVRGVDSGFDAPRVVAMNINLPAARYATPEARFAFFEDLAARVSALPGIDSAAYANRMPVRGGWSSGLFVDDGTTLNTTDSQAVSTAYFRTLGIPILRGRAFTAEDRQGAPPVVLVNAAFARAYLPGVDAVGHRVRRQTRTPSAPLEIVGVVADIHRAGPANPVQPQTYFPAAQTDLYPVKLADFAYRAVGDPKTLVADVQRAVWAIDPHQPVTRVGLLADIVRTTVAPRAFEATLMAAFSALALALAIVGVYGVVSDAVSRRTREIGLRMALGATRTDIVRLIGTTTMALVGASVAIGAGAAWLLSQTLTALLFGVSPTDLATYADVAVVLMVVALAASAVPMWRALSINPTQALRQE